MTDDNEDFSHIEGASASYLHETPGWMTRPRPTMDEAGSRIQIIIEINREDDPEGTGEVVMGSTAPISLEATEMILAQALDVVRGTMLGVVAMGRDDEH